MPCLLPGDLPSSGIESTSLMSPALAGRSLPLMPLGKPQLMFMGVIKRQTLSEGFPCFISFNPHNASSSQQLLLCHLGVVETGSEIICPGACSAGIQAGSWVPEPMLLMITMVASSADSVLTLNVPNTRLSVAHFLSGSKGKGIHLEMCCRRQGQHFASSPLAHRLTSKFPLSNAVTGRGRQNRKK